MMEAETAWAAGLFEGEGSISILQARSGTNRTTRWVKLSVQMTDRDVLERFCHIVGTGGVAFHHRGARPHHKDCWSWQASARKDVERILRSFLPWLGERRTAKVNIALELIGELRAVRPCEFCGQDFEPYRPQQRFCSKKHQEQAWQEANKEHLRAYHRQRYEREKATA